MNINSLNDDCLLLIFDKVFNLTDVQSCYKVCSQWKRLMTIRLSPVKYLLRSDDFRRVSNEVRRKSVFLYEDKFKMEADLYDDQNSKLSIKFLGPHNFPNLKILSLVEWYFHFKEDESYSHPSSKLFFDNLFDILSKSKSIKGVCQRQANFAPYIKNIEMVSCNVDNTFYNEKIGPKLTQIGLEARFNDFLAAYKCFPNVQILSVNYHTSYEAPTDAFFPNLETLILKDQRRSDYEVLQFACDFIDRCPRLQSAYIRSFYDPESISEVDVPNDRLKDLVILLEENHTTRVCSPSDLRKLLSRYVGLENFALRQFKACSLKHVKLILELFPKLVTLDMRYCRKIDKKAADFVDNFNKLHGRSIEFYYHPKDNVPWMEYDSDRVAVDLKSNFMKNYFFKNLCDLPLLLDSDD